MPKDLRSFIDQVARTMPNEIVTVTEEVDPRWGATAVAARLEQQQRFPTLVFRRVRGSEIPVVMISAHLDAQEPDRMRSLGATDIVPKPFEWEDLIGKIEELTQPPA